MEILWKGTVSTSFWANRPKLCGNWNYGILRSVQLGGRICNKVYMFLEEAIQFSPYSARMRKNAGKLRTTITPNTDTFYAVLVPYLMSILLHRCLTRVIRLWYAWYVLFSCIFDHFIPTSFCKNWFNCCN